MRVAISLFILTFGFVLSAAQTINAAPYDALYYPSVGETLTPAHKALGEKAATFLDGLKPGSTISVQVYVKNTGTLTWQNENAEPDNPFRLGYHWEGPETIWNGERTILPKNIAPGQSINLNATLVVPVTPGTYTLQWDMVEEGVTWFSIAGVPVASQLVGVGQPVGGSKRSRTYHQQLCEWTDCTGATEEQLKCPFPKITSGQGQLVRTGKFVYVTGCGFGEQEGIFLLKLQNGSELKLDLEGWYPGLVGGTIPEVPSGTPDQTAQLVIKVGSSQSNPAYVKFLADREIKLVPMDAVQVNECNDSADENICNTEDETDCEFFYGILPGAGVCPWPTATPHTFSTIEGYHANSFHIAGDVGWDEYTATVKNGYVIHDIKSSFQNIDGGHASNIEGFEKGGPSTTFTMQWSVDGYGAVYYTIDILALGPIGVPVN